MYIKFKNKMVMVVQNSHHLMIDYCRYLSDELKAFYEGIGINDNASF